MQRVPSGEFLDEAGRSTHEWPPITKGFSPRWFALFAALCFLGVAIWMAFNAVDPLGRWSETEGVVAEVVSDASDGDALVVRFVAPGGSEIRFRASADKASGHYTVGERVPVAYRASNAHDAHVQESSTRSLVGVLFCLAAAVGSVLLARAKGLHLSWL